MEVAVTISAWMLGVILIGSPPIRLKSSIGMRLGWLGLGLGLGVAVGLGLGLGVGLGVGLGLGLVDSALRRGAASNCEPVPRRAWLSPTLTLTLT